MALRALVFVANPARSIKMVNRSASSFVVIRAIEQVFQPAKVPRLLHNQFTNLLKP